MDMGALTGCQFLGIFVDLLQCRILFLDDGIHHFLNNFLSPILPLLSVFDGIVQVFITGNTKDTTPFQLFGQRNDIKIKEGNFSLVPIEGWISICTPFLECLVTFPKEALVPFAVDMPVGKSIKKQPSELLCRRSYE